MYASFSRKRMHSGEYNQGTNILSMCDIYLPEDGPHDYTDHRRRGGGPGHKEPT